MMQKNKKMKMEKFLKNQNLYIHNLTMRRKGKYKKQKRREIHFWKNSQNQKFHQKVQKKLKKKNNDDEDIKEGDEEEKKYSHKRRYHKNY